MDINYYLAREQVELSLSDAAESCEARAAHAELAGHYRDMIEGHRTSPAKVALAAERALAL